MPPPTSCSLILSRFKVRTAAETQREFPCEGISLSLTVARVPQHTRAWRAALETYARSLCSYWQRHITGPLWFYICLLYQPFHLGQWHNGGQERLKGATWTIWRTPFGVLTLWPHWSLHKDRKYNMKIKLLWKVCLSICYWGKNNYKKIYCFFSNKKRLFGLAPPSLMADLKKRQNLPILERLKEFAKVSGKLNT